MSTYNQQVNDSISAILRLDDFMHSGCLSDAVSFLDSRWDALTFGLSKIEISDWIKSEIIPAVESCVSRGAFLNSCDCPCASVLQVMRSHGVY